MANDCKRTLYFLTERTMKLSNIILLTLAVTGLCTGCVTNNLADPSMATEKSTYEVVQAGGDVEVTFVCTTDWSANVVPASSNDIVDDVKVVPSSGTGSIDKQKVKVSFGSNDGYDRSAVVQFIGEGVSGAVTVKQPGAQGELIQQITCAEFLKKPVDPNVWYILEGEITKIVKGGSVDDKYSNFYINDGSITDGSDGAYIYGLYDGKGGPQFQDPPAWLYAHGVTVGWTIKVATTRGQYNTTIEGVNTYPIEWHAPTKPMLSCAEPKATVSFTETGHTFAITALNLSAWNVEKGSDAGWVTDCSKDGNNVVVTFPANTGEERTASFTVSAEGVEDVVLTLTQLAYQENGTLDKPFTVAEAIDFCNALSSATADSYYVKGKFVKWNKDVDAFGANTYGNASFWISEDGQEYHTAEGKNDTSKMFEAYQVLWLGNKSWAEGDGTVGVGDEVVICGPLAKYNTTAETAGKGAAHIYSINGYTAWEAGISSTAPLTIEEAITKALATTEPTPLQYFVKGKFVRWNKDADAFGANTFGNASFWLSEDGTDYNDKAKEFEAYQVFWLGNEKWAEGNHTLAEGDEVVVRGQLTKYGTTAETTGKGSAYVFSVNGKYSEAEWAE